MPNEPLPNKPPRALALKLGGATALATALSCAVTALSVAARHKDDLLPALAWGAGASLLGIAFSLWAITKLVLRPLRELTRVTSEIVRSGDLTRDIAFGSNDELGELAATFARMLDKLREVSASLHQSAHLLGESVTNLSNSAAEQSQTVSRQAAALQETQVTAQEIKQTSRMAAEKAEAILKLAERADEIGRTGEEAIEQTLGGLTDIRAQVEEISRKIAELNERTQQIGGITQTVKDLADQSNMLALNAAIEAVRSGEHGKGFAVVAREIRSLADQSIQATNQVREILEDIGGAIRTAVSITETGAQRMGNELEQVKASGGNLRELSSIVKDNAAAVRQIAVTVGQQDAGISQIFTAVSELSNMMDETIQRLDSTNEAAGVLRFLAEQMSDVAKHYRVGPPAK